jgi:hypothetical protein
MSAPWQHGTPSSSDKQWRIDLTFRVRPNTSLLSAGNECWRLHNSQFQGAFVMSLFTRIAGVAAGVSAVAVLGVAIAQGEPPNPMIKNQTLGAGQQSTHLTPMGETGTPWGPNEVRTATLTKEPEPVAVAPAPEPAPVAAAPEAPAPVAQAPVQEPAQTMGAAPRQHKPMRVARADRN